MHIAALPARVRPLFAAAFLLAPLQLTAGSSAAAAAPVARPNVLLIVVDDLGWADLGCYGADLHETPHIDAFAAGAVRFTDAYAAAPVCSPTRAALVTGRHPARLHMTTWFESSADPPRDRPLVPPVTVGNLPHAETTLAERLRAAGYATIHVGKWHLGDAAHYPETHGYDVNIGGTFWGAPSTFFHPYSGQWSNTREFRYVPHLEHGRPGEYLTDRLTDEAIRQLEASADRPFFLSLCYHTVHTPIEGKPSLVDRYRGPAAAPNLHHRNADYAAMVHSLDENVGRLLARLDALGLADRTLVALTSDNGGYVNEHRGQIVTSNAPLRSGKGSLYEGGLRVPLVVRCPRAAGEQPPRGERRQPVVTMDFYPTVLEIAGVDAAADVAAHDSALDSALDRALDGASLVPVLNDPAAAPPHEALHFHYPHYYPTTTPAGALRQGDWKLVEYFEDGRTELYNLRDDLSESHDLSAENPTQTFALRRQLADWRAAVDAQMPVRNDR